MKYAPVTIWINPITEVTIASFHPETDNKFVCIPDWMRKMPAVKFIKSILIPLLDKCDEPVWDDRLHSLC